jgi:hypothetical protein
VIVPIVDQDCILAFKTKCHPPVAIDLHCPVASQLILQRVKIPSGKIHAVWGCGAIQSRQLIFEFGCMCRVDASLRAGQEEFFQSCVPEGLDRAHTVSLSDTEVNRATSGGESSLCKNLSRNSGLELKLSSENRSRTKWKAIKGYRYKVSHLSHKNKDVAKVGHPLLCSGKSFWTDCKEVTNG